MSDTVAVMPKHKSPKGETDTVRIDRDLAEMATIIAIRRKISVSELISPHLRAFLEAEYAKEVRKMNQSLPRGKSD